jgi:hypothetical protein
VCTQETRSEHKSRVYRPAFFLTNFGRFVARPLTLYEFAKPFSKKPPHWQLAVEHCSLFNRDVDGASGSNGEQ